MVRVDLDHCVLRYMPARNYPSPHREMTFPNIRVSLVKDEKVVLLTDMCTDQVSLSIINSREPSLKYRNYVCNLEVMVPEGQVLPGMVIQEHSNGYPSAVRGGPMDVDTRNFGLSFGPNQLQIVGAYMNVRLENVTAKTFHFDIHDGSIIGKDIVATDPSSKSTFKTKGADIILTTSKMTSVFVKQKSGNLVCLTAANNSLFVDDRRQMQCSYIDSNALLRRVTSADDDANDGNDKGSVGSRGYKMVPTPDSPMPHYSSLHPAHDLGGSSHMSHATHHRHPDADARHRHPDARFSQSVREYHANAQRRKRGGGGGERGERRTHNNYTIPEFGPEDMCPDGITSKSSLIFVPACTDTSLCRQSETDQCLCRPICDMIEPSELCFDGICGVAGKCDFTGKCCRLITREYSTADLFPTPDQPRDGAAVDPILFPWGPTRLEQQWQLESDTGQIAVTALEDMKLQYRVSSYKLLEPTPFVEQEISIPTSTKDLMDTLFHPSGAVRPKEAIYEFNTMGPGLGERQVGSIIWVASLVYLVIPSAILDTLSVGILKPFESKVDVRFSPAFCPAFVPEDDFVEMDRRLVLVREKLVEALQDYPAGTARKALPRTSAMVYKPTSGRPLGFKLDPKTSQIVVDMLYLESYTLIWAVLYSALALALTAALLIVFQCSVRLRATLSQFRMARFKEEEIFSNIQSTMRQQKESMAAARHSRNHLLHAVHSKGLDETESQLRAAEVVAYSDFFYILEDFLGDPHKEGTGLRRVLWAVQSLLVVSAPVLVVYLFASHWRTAVLAQACQVRVDYQSCLLEPEALSDLAGIVILVSIVIFAFELSCHYLRLAYTAARPLLRKLFYLWYALVSTLALVLLLLVGVWVLLGALVLPTKALPYAAAFAGVGANAATVWAKLRCFQHKVERAVAQRIECMRPMLRIVPRPILDTLLRKNLALVLKQESLSAPLLALSVLRQMVLLLMMLVFVFIAFASFTDAYDLTTSLFNTALVAVLCIAFNNQVRTDSNSKAAKDHVFEVQERLSQQVLVHLQHVHFQIQGAFQLFAKMRQQMRDDMDSDDLSQVSESLSFLSTLGSDQALEMPERGESPDADKDLQAMQGVKDKLRMLMNEDSDSMSDTNESV